VAFATGTAQAQDASVGASVTLENVASSNGNNNNHNVNENRNNVNVHVIPEFDQLDLPSSETNIWSVWDTNNSSNRARIDDNAYNGAIGVNQAVIVAGQDNAVRQGSFAIYVE